MPVKLNSTGGGSVTLTTPSTASDFTLTAPAQTATLITNSSGVLDIGSGQIYKDASGNVGIGTSSPGTAYKMALSGNNTGMSIQDTGSVGTWIDFKTGSGAVQGNIYYNFTNGYMSFGTATAGNTQAERARITSGGEFLVGVSSGNGVQGSVGALGYQSRSGRTGSFTGNVFNINWTGSAQLWIDTTNVGTITLTSDYRIKRNIETQDQPALDRVLQLRPVTYQMADYGNIFKASDDIREGFIAHELAAVIPSAVSGEKDAPDQLQSLKIDALCSVLVKAIQELKAENDDLKSRLTALEAK